MYENMNEGFIKDFIKGFKDGYKSVINNSKSKGVNIEDIYIKCQEGPVEYVMLTTDHLPVKDGETDLMYSVSAVDAEKYPIMAWSVDEWKTFEIVDPRTLKTLETVRTGKHTGPGFNFNTEVAAIAKVLNKYNLEQSKEVAGVVISDVVNKILEGADVRQSIYEAYKTKVDFGVQNSKDAEIKKS